MHRLALIPLLAIVVTLIVTAQTPQSNPQSRDQQELTTLERRWNEAYKNRDKVTLERLLAPDFVFTDDEGHLFKKAEYIDAVLNLVKVGSYEISDLSFRVQGTTAVVLGLWTGSFSVGGVDASGALRFTDTFTKASGVWRVLASHESRIPKATKYP